jgi:23S rRNA pseudouridine2457 synthase
MIPVPRYFIVYKPFGMLSQFSRESPSQITLANLDFRFPSDAYPVGRLDAQSEGLLILTNDKSLNHKLLNPVQGHERSYLVQVDGAITPEAIQKLVGGMTLNWKKDTHHTLPARAEKAEPPSWLPERTPPVRFRKNIPTSWIRLTLKEGKNHQVRKMTAQAGFPTLRLIRESIEGLLITDSILTLEGIVEPGKVMEIKKEELVLLLRL